MKNSHEHPLYGTWRSMKQRCLNKNVKSFRAYGARGITVCEEWRTSFEKFVADVGERPQGMTLDRINNERGYEPGNVRWASQSAQLRNQCRNRRIALGDKVMCLADWAASLGISRFTLAARIDRLGWSVEKALTTPVRAFRTYATQQSALE